MARQILTTALFLGALTCTAQIAPDTIQQRLARYNQNLPQEKIYMHLDRPHYAPGDTIWFKLYIADASTHAVDSVSKNIYVDLFRKDTGKKIRQLIVKNMGGFSLGNISLRDSLSEGVYEIRAFTNWMRNFSDAQFFHKEVYVRKRYALKDIQDPSKLSVLEVVDLQFFPEGGNLVAGMQSRVAFKGVNKYGKGVDFAAYVVSDRNDTVATIQSKHLGMGSFIFAPKAGQKYFAKVAKTNQGQSQKLYKLPEPLTTGYTFFVDNLGNKDMIKIMARNNFGEKDRPTLIGQSRGITIFNFQSAAEGNSFSWSLPKTDIPNDGVVQLTLFNSKGEPQCERLIYNDTKTPLTVTVASDKSEYTPYEKVTLFVRVKDDEGNPVSGNFSLAATDNQQVSFENSSEDIRTYFYLSSDVQSLSDAGVNGTIEQPGYYFNPENANASIHLDILLMSQGWRRFLWADVLNNNRKKEAFDIETGLSIRGNAKLTTGKKLAKPLNITLNYAPEPGAKTFDGTKTDLDGNFTFKNIFVKEPTLAMIQGSKENGNRSVMISVQDYKWPTIEKTKGLVDPYFFNAGQVKLNLEQQKHYAELEEQLKTSNAKVLKTVTVTAQREKVEDSRKMMYAGTSVQNVPITQQSCATAVHVLQMLQGRAAGLTIMPAGTGFTAIVRGPTSLTGFNGPAYLLDGMRIDESYLSGITPCMVESIDVITHPVPMYSEAKGVVAILTKQANPNYDWTKEEPQGTAYSKINGYDVARQFYSPRYFTVDDPKKVPDFRATLYWNPVLKTDADGKAQVTFWNSGETTSVRIAVEGISSEGVPAVGKHEYSVK